MDLSTVATRLSSTLLVRLDLHLSLTLSDLHDCAYGLKNLRGFEITHHKELDGINSFFASTTVMIIV